LITVGCLSILAGLGLSRKVSLDVDWWLILFTPVLLLLKKKNGISLAVVILLGLGLGMWRGGIYMEKLAELNALATHKVTIQATAKTDAVYGNKSQIEFTASDIQLLEPDGRSLAGSAKISGFGVPMVYRGDRMQVSGKLYPMRGSNQIRIAYAQLSVVGVGNSWFDKLTRTFSTGMENALPEPQASFGLGLLVGQRTNLPADVVTRLTMVGLVHIVAVSGYNLTILVRSAQRLRLQSKYQRTLLSLGLIISFILVTGFSASIVRAAVVSILSLWAWYFGRNIKPVLIILFAAALTAMFNPFYIWSDIGWYLSFLAFFGVLVIAPLLVRQFFSKQPQILTLVLIETLSAEIMTLPLIMMVFGQMSLVALLANLLVVPLIPAAMLLSTVAATAGAIVPQFAGWLALPARLLLTYILDLIHMLSAIPRIFIHLTINPTLMISLYVLVIALIATLHRRLKHKPGNNTLEVIK
jgi:competence protein ComEC